MFQEGKKALEEEVEGEEGTIEAKGEVVLLSVDELVTFITKGGKKNITCSASCTYFSMCTSIKFKVNL